LTIGYFALYIAANTVLLVSYQTTTGSPIPLQVSTACPSLGKCGIQLTETIWGIGAIITTVNPLLLELSGLLKMGADFLGIMAAFTFLNAWRASATNKFHILERIRFPMQKRK